MADRIEEFRVRLEELATGLRRLEERLARLEAGQAAGAEAAAPSPSSPATVVAAGELSPALALSGRTLVALGGGYLIRALTDSGTLPTLGGAALGLAYALFWLFMADRAAARGRQPSAAFHGLTSGLIAYPLLWETTTRMAVLTAPRAFVLLLLVFGAGMAVAARRGLGFLAWTSTVFALGTAASLLVATHHLLGAAFALLAVAAVVEAFALVDLWPPLRWLTALVVDAGLLALILLGSRAAGLPPGYPPLSLSLAVGAALLLPTLQLAGVVARTLVRGRTIGAFEVVQGLTALLLGFGGAWRLLAARGVSGTVALGATSVVLGALCYAAAFAFVERREGTGPNFYFYTTAGGLLTLAGSRALLAPTPLELLWCGLGLVAAALGRGFDRMTLRFHGVAYLGLGALAGGAAGAAWRAWLGSTPLAGSPPSLATGVATVAALGGYAVLAGGSTREARWWERLPQALAASVTTPLLAGAAVVSLARAVDRLAPLEPAAEATMRTAVLSGLAVALAALARSGARRELFWLVWPLLALGGVKVLTDDLREGRPVAVFLSLLFYGSALIAAPKLLKRGG